MVMIRDTDIIISNNKLMVMINKVLYDYVTDEPYKTALELLTTLEVDPCLLKEI